MFVRSYPTVFIFIFVVMTVPGLLPAAELAAPQGRVILVVSGNITHTNGNDVAGFDRAMLEALPGAGIRTETPWTEGLSEFRGPLLQAVLEVVGAQGNNLKAIALNDYAVGIPVSDAVDYHIILAMSKDGVRLSTRTRGPLWVIYPWSGQPQLKGDAHYSRSIWQLREIIVE
jgi:hypothetical protein